MGGFGDSYGEEERNTSLDDGFGGTSDSDFLSESESSKGIKLNIPQKHTQAQLGRGARVQNQSTTRMASSGECDLKGSVVDAASLHELTRENNRLKKMIIGIGNVAATGSQNRDHSKRSKLPRPTLPAGEVARCGLLSLPHEIIEVTSDDEANLFVQEEVVGPKTKQTTRGQMLKKDEKSVPARRRKSYAGDTSRIPRAYKKKKGRRPPQLARSEIA